MLDHASDWARFDVFLACFVFFGSGLHLSILISCHWFVVNTSVPDTTKSNQLFNYSFLLCLSGFVRFSYFGVNLRVNTRHFNPIKIARSQHLKLEFFRFIAAIFWAFAEFTFSLFHCFTFSLFTLFCSIVALNLLALLSIPNFSTTAFMWTRYRLCCVIPYFLRYSSSTTSTSMCFLKKSLNAGEFVSFFLFGTLLAPSVSFDFIRF